MALLLMFIIPWSIQIFSSNIVIAVLQPFPCVSRVIVINHTLDVGRVVVEVAESSACVVCLDVVHVNVVPDGSCEKSEELSDVSGVGVDE